MASSVPTPAAKPITVSANAPIIDLLTAAGRYLVVIATLFPVALAVLKTRDIAAILEFVRGNDGATLLAAIVGLATFAYGLYKSHKRGAQVATVAADPAVPDRVAQLKS